MMTMKLQNYALFLGLLLTTLTAGAQQTQPTPYPARKRPVTSSTSAPTLPSRPAPLRAQPSSLPRTQTAAPRQAAPPAMTPAQSAQSRESTRNARYLVEHGVAKNLITFEYNSWYEKLTITDPVAASQQDSQAEYYGFGINYERNYYQPTWGWGLGVGYAMGTAVGGDKAGGLQYFQARVPWQAYRFAPRLFYRWNPQTDLGVDLVTLYKSAKWPDETQIRTIKSGSDFVAGAFVDMRLRFNLKLEMIQGFGMLYKDESIFWRLGLAYRL
jgi:hypothetical protein